MAEEPDPERLRRLEERIKAVKRVQEPEPLAARSYDQASQGWRMVIELVSGLGIGFALGYGLDLLFGTLPIFLVLMTLAGFAAGVKTMLRTATEIQKGNAGLPPAQDHPAASAEDED
jgi:ATP synthase protein I